MPERRSLSGRVLLAFVWLFSAAHFAATGVRQSLRLFTSDFLAAFPSWRVASLMGRLDLYRGSLAEQWGPPPIWHYGPILHAITLPLFAFPSLRTAFVAWLFVNYVFVAITFAVFARALDGGRPSLATISIVVLGALSFNPFYEALTIRAIEVFELMLLVIAWASYRRGRSGTAGVLVGLAAMSKFLPLIYLPYFVLRRDWKALCGALASIVPVAIATELVFGWRNSGTLLQMVAPNSAMYMFEENQSLAGAVLRLVAWTGAAVNGVMLSRVAIVVALMAFSLLFLQRRNVRGMEDVEWWTLAVAMILLPPHNQNYYAILALPAYIILFVRYRAEGELASPRAVVLYLSYAVVGLPVPLTILSRIAGVSVWPIYLRLGLSFAGLALVMALLVAEMLRGRAMGRMGQMVVHDS